MRGEASNTFQRFLMNYAKTFIKEAMNSYTTTHAKATISPKDTSNPPNSLPESNNLRPLF